MVDVVVKARELSDAEKWQVLEINQHAREMIALIDSIGRSPTLDLARAKIEEARTLTVAHITR